MKLISASLIHFGFFAKGARAKWKGWRVVA